MDLTDLPRFALELKDRKGAAPSIRLDVHAIGYPSEHINQGNPVRVLGLDLTITNLSTSAFSCGHLTLSGVDQIPVPYVITIDDGQRAVKEFKEAFDAESFESDCKLAHIDPIPQNPYLRPRESIRGLVFWKLSVSELEANDEIEVSMSIPAVDLTVSAFIDTRTLRSR